MTTGSGVTLRPLFTPGHEDDHVCYFLRPDRVLFSGDNLLGNSSSSVRNLKQYMNSLGRMARTRPLVVCPGHGNTIIRGQQRIQQQIAHRLSREDQVLAALDAGAATVDEIVTAVYPRNLRRGPCGPRRAATCAPTWKSCARKTGSSSAKPPTSCRISGTWASPA